LRVWRRSGSEFVVTRCGLMLSRPERASTPSSSITEPKQLIWVGCAEESDTEEIAFYAAHYAPLRCSATPYLADPFSRSIGSSGRLSLDGLFRSRIIPYLAVDPAVSVRKERKVKIASKIRLGHEPAKVCEKFRRTSGRREWNYRGIRDRRSRRNCLIGLAQSYRSNSYPPAP
jgi:hypothetical protein